MTTGRINQVAFFNRDCDKHECHNTKSWFNCRNDYPMQESTVSRTKGSINNPMTQNQFSESESPSRISWDTKKPFSWFSKCNTRRDIFLHLIITTTRCYVNQPIKITIKGMRHKEPRSMNKPSCSRNEDTRTLC